MLDDYKTIDAVVPCLKIIDESQSIEFHQISGILIQKSNGKEFEGLEIV